MCADANCDTCHVLDALTVRNVEWCPQCGQREIGDGLKACVMCAAEQPNP